MSGSFFWNGPNAGITQRLFRTQRDKARNEDKLGEPNTNRELFDLIGKNGWLSPRLIDTMRAIVGFRNILVHGYQAVDLKIMRDVVENRLDDLLAFVDAIRAQLNST